MLETTIHSGVSNFYWTLNLDYSMHKYLSFFFYCENDTHVQVRVELADPNQYLALDFGLPGSGWEPSPIYDTNTVFKIGKCTNPHVDLDATITNAITKSGSSYSSYTPVTIVGLLFFNDGAGSSRDYIDLFQFNSTEPIWPELINTSNSNSTADGTINYPKIDLNLDSEASFVPLGLLTIFILRVISNKKRKSN